MRTIAHISDLHFGKIDEAIVEGLVADLASRKPSLVVVSGDLTQRARVWQYRQAAEFLARIPTPQLVVPGNHDIPLYDVIRRFGFPLDRYRTHIASDVEPVYRDDELLVVGVNTARSFTWSATGFWKDGKVAPHHLASLRRALQDVPETVCKVVVTHHPFIPRSAEHKYDMVHGARAALPTLEDLGVDVLLAGHLHVGYHGDVRLHHTSVKRSILSVQAGTATSTRCRGVPNSYNWLTLDPQQVTVEIRAWQSGVFSPLATTAVERCQTGSET